MAKPRGHHDQIGQLNRFLNNLRRTRGVSTIVNSWGPLTSRGRRAGTTENGNGSSWAAAAHSSAEPCGSASTKYDIAAAALRSSREIHRRRRLRDATLGVDQRNRRHAPNITSQRNDAYASTRYYVITSTQVSRYLYGSLPNRYHSACRQIDLAQGIRGRECQTQHPFSSAPHLMTPSACTPPAYTSR